MTLTPRPCVSCAIPFATAQAPGSVDGAPRSESYESLPFAPSPAVLLQQQQQQQQPQQALQEPWKCGEVGRSAVPQCSS